MDGARLVWACGSAGLAGLGTLVLWFGVLCCGVLCVGLSCLCYGVCVVLCGAVVVLCLWVTEGCDVVVQ